MTQRFFLYQSQFDGPAHLPFAETKNARWFGKTEPETPTPFVKVATIAVVATTLVGFVAPPSVTAAPPAVQVPSEAASRIDVQAARASPATVATTAVGFVAPPPAAAAPTSSAVATSHGVQTNRKVLYQSAANIVLPVAIPSNWGWSSEHPQVSIKPYLAAQQRFADYPSQGNVPTAPTPHGWQPVSYDPFVPQWKAALQQYEAFAPAGFISVPLAFQVMESPQVRVAPYNISLQQFTAWAPISSFPPPAAVGISDLVVINRTFLYQAQFDVVQTPAVQFTNWGWETEPPVLLGKNYNVAQQLFDQPFCPQGSIFSITPQGWMFQPPILLAKPYNVALQQVTAGPVFPYVSAIFTAWGWSSESPVLIGKPYNAAQQLFDQPFTPQGAVVSVTPQGWWGESPQVLIKGYRATLQQDIAAAVQQVPSPSTPHGWQFVGYDPFIPAYKVALQQVTAGTVFPYVSAQFTIWGWSSESPVLIGKSYNAAQQLFDQPFTPQGTIVSVTPQGGLWSESPQVRVQPYGVAQQQFASSFAVQGSFQFTNWGWAAESPVVLGKFYKATLQQDISYAPFQVPSPTTPHGWQPVIYEPYVPPYKAALQQVTMEPVFPYVSAPFTIWGWSSESPVLIGKPFNAAQQLFDQPFAPQGTIVSFTPQGGLWSESPQILIKGYKAALQQDITAAIQQVPTATFPHGWQPVIWEPVIPGYKATLQQVTMGPVFPYTTTPEFTNVGDQTESPQLFVKPYPAAQQQFEAFAPQGTIVSVTPQGWWNVTVDPVRPVTRLAASQAQFAAIGSLTPPVVVTAFGAFPAPSDPIARRSPLTDQPGFVVSAAFQPVPFADTAVFTQRVKPAPVQEFWWYALFTRTTPGPFGFSPSPDVYLYPNKVGQWPVVTYPPEGNVPTKFFPDGWSLQSPDIFIKGFPAFLQQVTAMPVRFIVPPTRIIQQPKLSATHVSVTFKGEKSSPQLSGTKAPVKIKGDVVDP